MLFCSVQTLAKALVQAFVLTLVLTKGSPRLPQKSRRRKGRALVCTGLFPLKKAIPEKAQCSVGKGVTYSETVDCFEAALVLPVVESLDTLVQTIVMVRKKRTVGSHSLLPICL